VLVLGKRSRGSAVAARSHGRQRAVLSEKIEQLEQPKSPGQSTEVRLNAQEVNAAIAQAAGALSGASGSSTGSSGNGRDLRRDVTGDLGAGEPDIKDYRVNFEGDVAKGQF